jgi:acyl-CoA reductase-like NAD-dependent aldehyde dehydrogenase
MASRSHFTGDACPTAPYTESLPFGGVGESSMGHYYGEYGFRELSHARAVAYARLLLR